MSLTRHSAKFFLEFLCQVSTDWTLGKVFLEFICRVPSAMVAALDKVFFLLRPMGTTLKAFESPNLVLDN